ncbi:MAG: hypothetical protein LBM97_01455 [Candidatus Nomurabacteria bacterium]|jgi:hypothetical protein|nr:hypothetical protein [Candidatus Nomurabacteria bacterium]
MDEEIKAREIIYIEADDEITDILELLKNAAAETILLIPPKNAELLQSRVNMKLLARTAREGKKELVLITPNAGVANLAKSVGVLTAKTKQGAEDLLSGEVAEDLDAEVKSGNEKNEDRKDDVIDGEALSEALSVAGVEMPKSDDKQETEITDDDKGEASKKKVKIPSFGKLRNKIIIGVVVLLVLIGVGYWAFVIAPSAKVIVVARTNKTNFNQAVQLFTDEAKQDLSANQLFVVRKEVVKLAEVEFAATGEKNVGEKATGTITLTRKYVAPGLSENMNNKDLQIAPDTVFVDDASGLKYVFKENKVATLTKCTSISTTDCGGRATIEVVADGVGTNYNDVAKAYSSDLGNLASAYGTAMAGGTNEIVKVVTDDDITLATGKLNAPSDVVAKEELAGLFNDEYVQIEASIDINRKEATSSVKVGDRADGAVKLTQETVYSQLAVPKVEVGEFLDEKLATVIKNQADQKIYSNGLEKAFFDGFALGNGDGTMTAQIKTTYEVGPEIDEALILERSKGGTVGEIQKKLSSINGVRDVDVVFSFPWVSRVPEDEKKITIEFEVE